ncbi:hypothetical protein [Nesterenkonia jeotgali]|uniref:Uncharacterized protein n=1 Tax=Nesterenkonia jeotgali TaxID=317018 RepID=A0A0W8ICW5_9MICC|nr:hypothetical protein [Nesterenkonia jeotgali]KUG57791.1 hypothetical protein AVL63_04510 [Nesterenkonia jeotgali]
MDLLAVGLMGLGWVFVVLGVVLFFFLRGLSRGTVHGKCVFWLGEDDLEQLKRRAEFGAHWVVGTSFVVTGFALIWVALSGS